jgi:hypothetical protein
LCQQNWNSRLEDPTGVSTRTRSDDAIRNTRMPKIHLTILAR